MRLKIYCLLATLPVLNPNRGDIINEINLYKTLSLFADVYYNDQLFTPDLPNFGIVNRRISVPKRKYDLYYVRNHRQMFMKLPHPKIYLGTPYHDEVFRDADGIVVMTESWKVDFESDRDSRRYQALLNAIKVANFPMEKNVYSAKYYYF